MKHLEMVSTTEPVQPSFRHLWQHWRGLLYFYGVRTLEKYQTVSEKYFWPTWELSLWVAALVALAMFGN